MKRRNLAYLLAGLLLVATVAAAVVILGAPRVPLTRSPNDVDRVTLYQNGLAFIEVTRAFQSPGGESLLVLPLPLSARLDSLTFEGAGVTLKQVRGAGQDDGSLKPGDALVVHVVDGKQFQGTYAGRQQNAIVLASSGGTTLVEASQIVAIEVSGRAAPEEAAGSTEALALVEAPAGPHTVHVTYLAQGPGWTPSYELDAATGHVLFRATLTGLDDWHNVSLDLVSGAPHVVLQPTPAPNAGAPIAFAARASASGAVADEVGASTPLGELHRYHYDRPLDVSRGESVRILVEEGTLDVVSHREDVDANVGYGGTIGARQDVGVYERLEVRNTLAEPLPPGVVLAYRDGTWVGEDMLPATPRGERSNLTLATSQDVVAKLVLEEATSTGTRDHAGYALTVTNRKATAVDVHAALTYPTYRVSGVAFDPSPAVSQGGRAEWYGHLDPGASATFRIRYETDRS